VPAVLVHGVPETPAVWDPLRSRLSRTDVVALQLPGFGCARPEGFGATKEEYVAWLIGELEGMQAGDPVDVVGHDWSGGLVARLVSLRPDLVRSWASDTVGFADAGFEWHEFAKLWQTPGAGEDFWDQMLAQPVEERSAVFQTFGVPSDQAVIMAAGVDRTMAGCILALYRSAVHVGKEWSPDFHDVPVPGLVMVPTEDPFLSLKSAQLAADRVGATVAELAGVGHWWMLQDPAPGVAALERFWASL
jgi:pimeloyl-ACP methyl ester carboxylesterase